MLETLAVILVLMWLLGMVTSYTMSGFIHLLLLLALVVVSSDWFPAVAFCRKGKGDGPGRGRRELPICGASSPI